MKQYIIACVLLFAVIVSGRATANDGWMGQTATWSLYQSSGPAILVIRCLVPTEFGSNTLQVDVDGENVATFAVTPGDHDLRSVLIGAPGDRSVTLTWARSSTLPYPDSRHVSARIQRIAIDPVQSAATQWTPDTDIAPAGGPVGLGSGWQPLETWQGNTFRWLSGPCQIAIHVSSDSAGALTLDAQPGAGTNLKAAQVHLLDKDGNLVDSVEIDARMRIDLVVSSKALAAQPLSLVVVNGGATTKEDPRALDLQVFSCVWTPLVD